MQILVNKKNILIHINLIIIFFLLAISLFLEIADLNLVLLPFSIYCIITIFLFVIFNTLVKDKFVSKIFLLSVLFHSIFILFWHLFKYHILGYHFPTDNIFNPFTIDNDGVLYHSLGIFVSKNLSYSTMQSNLTGGFFPKIIGILYFYFGRNPFIPCLLNCIISGFTAIFIYLIGKNVLNTKSTAKIYSLVSILTFAHIMNTSVLIRDSYITLFMYSSLYLSYLFYKTKNLLWLFLTFFSLYLLYSFRPYAAYVLLSAVLVSLVLCNLKSKFKNKQLKVSKFTFFIYLFLPILLIGFIFLIKYFFSSITLLQDMSVESLIDFREAAYQFGNAEIAIDFGALYSKFFLLPFIVGYIYLFFAPFPWEWIYAARIVYIPDMLILYCILPSFFKNIKIVFTDKKFLLVCSLLSIIFMFSFYCITLGNSGAIHRLRGPYIPMIYLIALYRPDKLLNKLILNVNKAKIL